jgi:hypothetical protein
MKEKRFSRKCPNCNNSIYHTEKWVRDKMERNKIICLFCSNKNKMTEEVKKKIGISNSKHKRTEEQKLHLKNLFSGVNHPQYGKHQSKERRQKISNKIKGIKRSEETKQRLREIRAKQIIAMGGGPMYNPKACKYLDQLNKQNNWSLQHALNGGEYSFLGYFVDGYDKDRNIVVEYDEPKHQYHRWKIKDEKRQKQITEYLKCKFYRYNEKQNLFYKSV